MNVIVVVSGLKSLWVSQCPYGGVALLLMRKGYERREHSSVVRLYDSLSLGTMLA